MARECLRCGFCRSKVWSKYFYSLLIGKNIRKFPTMELIDLEQGKFTIKKTGCCSS
ncbi:7164_t:CDS:2 [Rhizophagus irregularis]|nr:7164_t:CDS:2 [Rhizophagus irregularis]